MRGIVFRAVMLSIVLMLFSVSVLANTGWFGLIGSNPDYFYALDSSSGTVVVDEMGLVNGTATSADGWTGGFDGNAYLFNPNYIYLGTETAMGMDVAQTSYCAWTYLNSTTGNMSMISLGARLRVGVGDIEDSTCLDDCQNYSAYWFTSEGNKCLCSDITPVVKSWTYVCFTFDETNDEQKLYVDGSLRRSGTDTLDLLDVPERTIDIGYDTQSLLYLLDGLIDDIVIWKNYIVTASDIHTMYNGYVSSLVLEYKFDDDNYSQPQDTSGYGNHGVFVLNSSDYNPYTNVGCAPVPDNNGCADFSVDANAGVEFPNLGIMNESFNWSVSLWFEQDSIAGNGIFWMGAQGMTLQIYGDTNPSKKFYVLFQNGESEVHATFPDYLYGSWIDIVTTYNEQLDNFTIYMNGTYSNSWVGINQHGGAGYNMISGWWNQASGFAFNGKMDEFKIYSKALTSDETMNLYLYNNLSAPAASALPILFANWSLDDDLATTTVIDSVSGNNLEADVNTDTISDADAILGRSFDLTGNHYCAGDINLSSHSKGTVDMWYKTNNSYSGSAVHFWSYYITPDAEDNYIGLYKDFSDDYWIQKIINVDDFSSVQTVGVPFEYGDRWIHITVRQNETHLDFFIDAVLRYSTNEGVWINETTEWFDDLDPTGIGAFVIGKDEAVQSTGYLSFEGLIDDVKVYNYPLSDAEILAINYTYYPPPVETPPSVPVIISPVDGGNYSSVNIEYSSVHGSDPIRYYVYIDDVFNQSSLSNITDWVAGDGVYSLKVSARVFDDMLFSENSSVVTFTKDTVAPVVQVINPMNSSVYNTDTVYLDWSGAGYRYCLYELDGVNVTGLVIGGVAYNATLLGVSQGSHSVKIYCDDYAGNIGQSGYSEFYVDSMPPVITVTTVDMFFNDTYNNLPMWINMTTDEASTCLLSDAQWSLQFTDGINHAFADLLNATEQFYDITVSCNDSLGNLAQKNIYFTIDRTPPFIYPVSPSKYGDTSLYTFGVFSIEVSGTDNAELYAYYANITKVSDNSVMWTYSNETLSGTVFNFSRTLDVSGWQNTTYRYCNMLCDKDGGALNCDSECYNFNFRQPPVISLVVYNPSLSVSAALGQSVNFDIEANSTDPLALFTYQWTVNNAVVATTEDLNYLLSSGHIGSVYNVTVTVTDDSLFLNSCSSDWLVTITSGFYQQYGKQDLRAVIIDGIGTAGASVVSWVDMIVLLVLLSAGVGMVMLVKKR